MKIKQLRDLIAGLDDNAEVLLSVNCGTEGLHETTVINVGTRRQRTVVLWGDKYNTKEVFNAYRCNDDRYGGPAFCIEVGEDSP